MSISAEDQEKNVICNLISQRTRFLSLLKPSPRYTLVSPYPKYTKTQLDMRRKVEILQYKNIDQTTKSQKWSQLSNASNNRYISCNKNPYVVSLSSACDVPGPLTYLSYDPTVPLYNYVTKWNTYSSFYTAADVKWEFLINNDISGGNMVPAIEGETEPLEGEEGYEIIEYEATPNTLVGTLLIKNITELQTNYKFTIPIGLFASGLINGTPNSSLQKVQITHAALNIYFYNDNVAGSDPKTPPLFSIPITNSLSNTNIMDMSMTFVPTVIDGNFNCNQYIGDIIIPNINLTTSYGFLYDFRLYFELSFEPVNNLTINHESLLFGVYFNMPPYDMRSTGCIVTPQRPGLLSNYLPFSLTST